MGYQMPFLLVRISGWGLESVPNCWHIYGDVQALDLAGSVDIHIAKLSKRYDLASLKLSEQSDRGATAFHRKFF